MSTAHPDRRFVEADSWTTTGSKSEMLDTFADFCPRVQKLLRLVPEGDVLEWKLRVHEPLTHWTDRSVALVGDACHPTLPHLAQGAAQAIEDAAVLGFILGKIQKLEDVPKALLSYEVSMATASLGRALFKSPLLSSGVAETPSRLGGTYSGSQWQGVAYRCWSRSRSAECSISGCDDGGCS